VTNSIIFSHVGPEPKRRMSLSDTWSSVAVHGTPSVSLHTMLPGQLAVTVTSAAGSKAKVLLSLADAVALRDALTEWLADGLHENGRLPACLDICRDVY
jgi:hypothetical protein